MNEMAKVEGSFDVTLPVPISSLGLTILNRNVTALEFEIDNANVELSPGRFTNIWVDPETDEPVPPHLGGIKVRITRAAGVTRDEHGNRRLDTNEEHEFERILIEATRRFVTAVKRKTRQWSLNTRYPIYSYACAYLDTQLSPGVQFLPPRETGRLPQYWFESMTYDTPRELSGRDWSQVAIDVQQPVDFPFYQELILDAESFRAQMRWDSTIMSAAIGIELILRLTYSALLARTGDLSDEECEKLAEEITTRKLVNKIAKLEGTFASVKPEVHKLLDQRNDAAHGKRRDLSSDDAAFAIRIAGGVQSRLSPVLPKQPHAGKTGN